MFLMDWLWAVVAIAGIVTVYGYIRHKEVRARWGDLRGGLLFERTRRSLLRLEEVLSHPKNWRPIILAMSGAGWDRPHLAVCGHWLTTGRGILSLGQVIHGDVRDQLERRANQERILHKFIEEKDLVVVAEDLPTGIESLVQCQGLGALRPNTVLFGWPTDQQRGEAFGSILRLVAGLGRSIVAVRFAEESEDPWETPIGTLDVWWRGRKNGELMLLLAHLLKQNRQWRTHRIRLLRVIENEAGQEEVLQHLHGLIESSRIEATAHVVVSSQVCSAIQRESRNAAIVFLGFDTPTEGEESVFYQRMEHIADDLPRVILVDSVGGMSLDS
jgi:hypothetical protein